ncbi:hypothetical protein AYI70_g1074 [Smittium culicis]|uniref:Uncharacterized protein n=1 Tax=Smittium culicis TaxID=133412 RepID=A0A1R1YEF9_9FUNG|nr:hypothetical protein AYI70_g6415 [Smittium culicis]OMJ25175.1 hypothetical protein AYI70_g1074 [Smittium culicis]
MAENKSTSSSSEIFSDTFNHKNDTPKTHAQSSQQKSSSGLVQNINEKISRIENSSNSQKLQYRQSEIKNPALDHTPDRLAVQPGIDHVQIQGHPRGRADINHDRALVQIQGRLNEGADTDHVRNLGLIKGRVGTGSIRVRVHVHILNRDNQYPNQRVLGATIILKGSLVNPIPSKQ